MPVLVDEFDTESELGDGDRISLRSYQSSQHLTEEELAKVLKKQQRAAQRRQREQELKRLRMAQEIQRQLEEVEIKQREVEKRGVTIERALRGDGSGKENKIIKVPIGITIKALMEHRKITNINHLIINIPLECY